MNIKEIKFEAESLGFDTGLETSKGDYNIAFTGDEFSDNELDFNSLLDVYGFAVPAKKEDNNSVTAVVVDDDNNVYYCHHYVKTDSISNTISYFTTFKGVHLDMCYLLGFMFASDDPLSDDRLLAFSLVGMGLIKRGDKRFMFIADGKLKALAFSYGFKSLKGWLYYNRAIPVGDKEVAHIKLTYTPSGVLYKVERLDVNVQPKNLVKLDNIRRL